jgi:hypothetical protein
MKVGTISFPDMTEKNRKEGTKNFSQSRATGRGERLITNVRILQGIERPFCVGHSDCLAGTVDFHRLFPQGTQVHFDIIMVDPNGVP